MASPRTLIADDQPDLLHALQLLLKGQGYQIEAVSSPRAVLEALRAREFDLLLMDLNYARDTTSGTEGLRLLEQIQAMDTTLPIIVMTAWGSTHLAVEAMQRGACDFIEKPWENEQLLAKLRRPLQKRLAEHARRAKHPGEMQEAREIQMGLLPHHIPRIPGYEIAVEWQPVGVVGGDSFDVLRLNDESVALCIADAVGKGVPAALLMSHLQATVRAVASPQMAPRELAATVNTAICTRMTHGRFISFFYAQLDAPQRRLSYTNAGHPAPILLHSDGSFDLLGEGGPILGEFPAQRFDQSAVMLRQSDRLVLFTDGIVEAPNSGGEEFGLQRLLQVGRHNRMVSADTLRDAVMAEVRSHCAGTLSDDATLIILGVA
ncbi:MAG TPA: SpoIIE family protein phosphatase [Candidatus Dormibacteraeota bacterium]|nr:SpoIIE family protein phosphatase [Candidatus Dormibacteraeota bacterium]